MDFLRDYWSFSPVTRVYVTACILTTFAVQLEFVTFLHYLEEDLFDERPADFLYMFIFDGTLLLIMALFVNIVFLGSTLTMMLVTPRFLHWLFGETRRHRDENDALSLVGNEVPFDTDDFH
ncbi:unnamed protein product [Rotaria sp. Silwood1]|nr:unnamed protein product [Rotaria sp. Silwood1]